MWNNGILYAQLSKFNGVRVDALPNDFYSKPVKASRTVNRNIGASFNLLMWLHTCITIDSLGICHLVLLFDITPIYSYVVPALFLFTYSFEKTNFSDFPLEYIKYYIEMHVSTV